MLNRVMITEMMKKVIMMLTQRNLKEKTNLIFFGTYSIQAQIKLVFYFAFKSVIYNTCQETGSFTKL